MTVITTSSNIFNYLSVRTEMSFERVRGEITPPTASMNSPGDVFLEMLRNIIRAFLPDSSTCFGHSCPTLQRTSGWKTRRALREIGQPCRSNFDHLPRSITIVRAIFLGGALFIPSGSG